jgi:BirA family transcriptional regulator, biotin operon repressor / biotin---[acetyl-CoA-carboxylase] ligase
VSVDLERVAALLNPGEIRWALHFEAECASTQDLARTAALQGAAEGWAVVTDLQRRGRGRSGRAWIAPAGRALTFSIVLQPAVDVLPLLPLLAAITVAGGIEAATRASTDLKWPNDILLDGKKLAGVLLEHPPGPSVIVGIGVNVNQAAADLPPGATSLAIELGQPVEREALLAAILNDLGNAYERADREGVQWILPGWRSRSSMLGKPVSFQRDGTRMHGIAEDIGLDGALLVRTAEGARISVVAGEVELVRVD